MRTNTSKADHFAHPAASTSVALLVVSCDRYADLWPVFIGLIDKFWPRRPFKSYFLSNHLVTDFPGFESITIGPDVSWSANVMCALSKIGEPYVIMILDDLLLTAPVHTEEIDLISQAFINLNGNCLKLAGGNYSRITSNGLFGEMPKGGLYRVSTVCTLWKKALLEEILRAEENAWQFEINGTIRADDYEGFYSTHKVHLRILNAVVRGKWRRSAVATVRELLGPTTLIRPQMSIAQELWYNFTVFRSKLMAFCPPGIDRFFRNLFKTKI